MKILDLIKRPFVKNMIDADSIDDILLKALVQGETISKDEAMTIPSVFSAVDTICNTIAMIPIELYKKNGDKVEHVLNDNRVFLLNNDTKDTLTGFQFKHNLVEDYLLDKGGYAYIKKQGNKIIKLNYVEAKYINILSNQDPINKRYKILANENQYADYNFLKILRNSKDGSSGEKLIDQVSKAVETAYQTMIYQLTTLKIGGNKRGYLMSKNKLSKESLTALKDAWEDYLTNKTNGMVLNDGVEFKEASNSSVEMQLNENKNTLNKEIDNIFHIKSNFNETFKEAILPIIRNIECSLNRDLLLEKEKKEGYYFAFDLKEILKGLLNDKERYEAYKIAKETGWITLNEIRGLENRDAIEGLDIIAMSLGNVIYDTKTSTYFTPNTDSTNNLNTTENENKGGDEDGKIL